MKKFVISIVAICAMMIFVACGGNTSDKKDNNGDKTDSTDTEEENDGDKTDTGDKTDSGDTGDKTDTSDTGDKTDTEDPSDSGDSTSDEDTADTSDSTDEGDTAQGDTGSEENPLYAKFVGRWAAEIILNSESSTPNIMAKNIPSITTRYVLVDFYVNDKGQLDMNKVDNKLCRTDNRTGKNGGGTGGAFAKGNVKFNEPYKFNTIFWHWKPYEIPGQEDMPYVEVAQNGDKITFKLNKDYELRGACEKKEDCNPTEMDGDSWINDKNDARIFDHDNDGKPAFTIGFNSQVPATASGDMYYVQKLTHIFEGTLIADDKIEGSQATGGGIEWTDLQFAHSATKSSLADSKTTTTYKEKSIFQFRKVDNAMDCDTLLGQLDTVFDLFDPNAGDAVGKE